MGSIEQEKKVLFPDGGCDTHHHIFEPHNFPYSPNRHLTPPKATIEDYVAFKQSLGITSSILTHGLSYGDDCSSLRSFIKRLGTSVTRGCAVINEQTTDDEIDELHASGTRGIRLDLYRYGAMVDLEKQKEVLQMYAQRIRAKGWFLEFLQINPTNWLPLGRIIPPLGVQVVTDHHGLLKARSMLPADVGVLRQPGFSEMTSLLETGSFWIKLSAPYRSSTKAPYYDDMKPIVLALVNANPRRVLWGSDWPHTPNMKVRSRAEALMETAFQKIDDRAWLTSLRSWLADEQWRLLMVENPRELYDM
ncbi:hypothetical protein B0J14DRAFT_18993 [Halenospora varia]|nr:hypothetical protein B0J14DRAFT_18993 [Halenospora varia]